MALQLPVETILRPGDSSSVQDSGQEIGRSRQGRQILGYRFGQGPLRLSLIAGCHADEPVGPGMLKKLVGYLARLPQGAPELVTATWFVVPHINPDGAARNAPWTSVTRSTRDWQGEEDLGYELPHYLSKTLRELPGDDVEFGFPRHGEDQGARPENRAAAAFLKDGAPFALHASFHGMGLARGPWFLMEKGWIDRTHKMRDSLRLQVRQMGYEIFDIDRKGEKGFWRIDEGFTTRPDSRYMAAFFEEQGDPETAAKFRPSSMEMVRSLGGDPLTLVSEMPLFLLPEVTVSPTPEGPLAEVPLPVDRPQRREFVAWARQQMSLKGSQGTHRVREAAAELGIRPMPIRDQMRLQLAFLNEGLKAVDP